MEHLLPLLPHSLQQLIRSMPQDDRNGLEEIRCRTGSPVELVVSGKVWASRASKMPVFQSVDADGLLQKISRFSLYALEEELRQGYVTVEGGHRIGLAGRVITEKGRILRLRDVTFFNIRLAKQKIGSALPLVSYLYHKGSWQSTLIIGAPQTGKTTILRDLTRLIGEGIPDRMIPASKVGVVDERSEIAGCVHGVPQNRIGRRTDVMDGCPKADGMMMMIRSMSPNVLVVDEIGRQEDTDALLEALNAGVTVLATVHGYSLDQLRKRPSIQLLIEWGLFDRYLLLSRSQLSGRSGSRVSVLNKQGTQIAVTEAVWQ